MRNYSIRSIRQLGRTLALVLPLTALAVGGDGDSVWIHA